MPAHASGVPATMPEPIRSNVPGSFAWGVLHQRHQALIAKVRDAFPYPPQHLHALDDLLAEVTTGKIGPLPRDAHDHGDWDRWGGADYYGHSWPDVPFLWAESYFYRKLLAAVGYFAPGPWQGIDPFQPQKASELADRTLETDLASLDSIARLADSERAPALTAAALWANRADIGFRLSDPEAREREHVTDLVADDTATLWQHLDSGAPGGVHVVADNAGRELLADLILIDHLLQAGRADRVELHLKPHPYYISDATGSDLLACLNRLRAAGDEAAAIGQRLMAALRSGQLHLDAHRFYCTPLTYHDLPADLATRFASAKLVILKGDLNYRRLVGDLHWQATTPFTTLTSYFPGPVAVLRTLKSDVAVGVDPGTLAALDATGVAWRTSGTHAMIQMRT